MNAPDKPGKYTVGKGDARYAVTVRPWNEFFEAQIPEISERWHFVDWLTMQGFRDWEFVGASDNSSTFNGYPIFKL